MSESKEAHRLRMQLKRKHPDWDNEQIKLEMSKTLKTGKSSQGSQKGSQSSHISSQKQQPTVEKKASPEGSQKGSQSSQVSSQPLSMANRIFIKIDHSVDKYQIILSESLDALSWKYIGTLTKGQPFERNNVVIIATWHKGSEKEKPEQELKS